MSENDFKSFVKFVIHRNKIYSFLNSLNFNEMNVSFEDLLKYLETKKYNIFKFTKFLNTYSVDITVREFNLIFLINFHSDEIIKYTSENSKELINSSQNLFNYLTQFDLNDKFSILKLCNRIKRFTYNFRKWKEIDKIEIIKDLGSEYYRLENIKIQYNDKNENELYINELEKLNEIKNSQNNILNEINKLDGMKIFNNLKPIEIEYDKKSLETIKKLLEDQYWELLKEDLKQQPINSIYILSLVDEIKDIIYIILKKRIDMLIDLEKNVNINSLKEDFDTHYFIGMIMYLLETLRKLQSPAYDELTDNYIKLLNLNMIEGSPLHEFIPKIIKYLMNGFYVVLIEKYQALEKFNDWKEKNENIET